MSHITERAYGGVNIKQNYDRDVAEPFFFFIFYHLCRIPKEITFCDLNL